MFRTNALPSQCVVLLKCKESSHSLERREKKAAIEWTSHHHRSVDAPLLLLFASKQRRMKIAAHTARADVDEQFLANFKTHYSSSVDWSEIVCASISHSFFPAAMRALFYVQSNIQVIHNMLVSIIDSATIDHSLSGLLSLMTMAKSCWKKSWKSQQWIEFSSSSLKAFFFVVEENTRTCTKRITWIDKNSSDSSDFKSTENSSYGIQISCLNFFCDISSMCLKR